MAYRRLTALLLAGLIACAPGCTTMDWSPDGKKIVTIWPGVGDHTVLRVVDLQTGRSRTLPGSRDAISPTWSPDGRWIAFARDVSGSQRAYLYDVQKGKTTVIGTKASAAFVWREDSARLLVCTPEAARCYAMPDAILTWEAELPSSAYYVAYGAWVADTDSVVVLAVGSEAGGGDTAAAGLADTDNPVLSLRADLWLIEGAELTRLTTTGDILGFGVRPGGKEIIWARASRNARYILLSLYAMPLKERSSRRLPLPSRVAEINPSPRTPIQSVDAVAFSSDGRRIVVICAYAPARPGGGSDTHRAYVMDLDGRNARAPYPVSLGEPFLPLGTTAFSPDGRRLSLLIGAKRRADLWVCNADGTGGRSVMTAQVPAQAR
ncbi:MAG: hypothetical protein FJX72_08780 [Armatimonadetes bacterium]|nr:hypothetical protein [Armatimonadota bacterium]